MTAMDMTMVLSGDDQKNVVPPWLRPIASIKLYDLCKNHSSRECNFYCRVCMVALCKECKKQHDLSEHEIIKAYKVAKVASFRMEDLEPFWDIFDICPYNQNGWLVAVIYKKGDGITRSRDQTDAAECESCHYRLKSSGSKYCSVECKVEAVMKINESGNMKNEAKRTVETIPEGSASNVQSFRKRPRKQTSPQRAPFY
ncbi:uncharacterized protein LOC115726626 [Rhodamnia argentea]|uniref:Uncharacterized protein LOC115726626 n=1 Tax=Rhodamnia argentea TaxID=178133 RepID=A0A8B8MR98_9MYRT|nr:uncharacterized protein LOC115726626 [Rhodamnia argentea]